MQLCQVALLAYTVELNFEYLKDEAARTEKLKTNTKKNQSSIYILEMGKGWEYRTLALGETNDEGVCFSLH